MSDGDSQEGHRPLETGCTELGVLMPASQWEGGTDFNLHKMDFMKVGKL